MYNEKKAGLYIHIPFCISKCRYCDFYSKPCSEQIFERYRDKVCEVLKYYETKYARCYNSLYFGGGTPLYFGSGNLCTILDTVKGDITEDAEVTAEGNPGTAKAVDFKMLKEHGVNRISLGLQSSDRRELEALGRIHSAYDAEETIKSARISGIENISLDIMLGIPYQTEESLKETVRFCAGTGVKHISAYMLKIEDNTPLSSSDLRFECADDDKMADLYLCAVDELKKYGYMQYEISNFSVPGYESKHNLKYWHDDEYIGIGPSAHSYMDGRRFFTDRNMDKFMTVGPCENEIYESEGGGWEEYAMLRLRLTEGLDINRMKEKYPDVECEDMLERAEKYENAGLLKIKGSRIIFTPNGFLLSNSLTAEILYG